MTDTNVATLILNKLSQAQYESATKSPTELYLTPDTPASTTVLGPVKVDGTTITAAADGTISTPALTSIPYATSSAVGGVRISVDANNVVTIYTGD